MKAEYQNINQVDNQADENAFLIAALTEAEKDIKNGDKGEDFNEFAEKLRRKITGFIKNTKR